MGDIGRKTLEVLQGGRLCPQGVQVRSGSDRRLERHAALAIRDDIIAAPGDSTISPTVKSSLLTAVAIYQS